MGLNRWIGMGRICNDIELKQTPSGVEVATFSIAIDRNYQTQSGEKQTDFLNVVVWRKTATFVKNYFAKGSMICVEGSIQTRSYDAQDGSKRYVTEVVADSVHFTGEKTNTATAQAGAAQGYAQPQTAQQYPQTYTAQPQMAQQYAQPQQGNYIPNAYTQPNMTPVANEDDIPF